MLLCYRPLLSSSYTIRKAKVNRDQKEFSSRNFPPPSFTFLSSLSTSSPSCLYTRIPVETRTNKTLLWGHFIFVRPALPKGIISSDSIDNRYFLHCPNHRLSSRPELLLMKELNFIETAFEQSISSISYSALKKSIDPLPITTPAVLALPVFDVIKQRILSGHKFNLDCDQDDAFFVGKPILTLQFTFR